MKHETLEQAFLEARDLREQGLSDSLKEMDRKGEWLHKLWFNYGFKAGTSWREQQAASGFDEWYPSGNDFGMKKMLTHDACLSAWQASQLSSAKLLAEKDKEIERLNFIVSFTLFNTRANYIDKESRELFKKITKDFEPAISWNEFVKENAEKIKTILGEE